MKRIVILVSAVLAIAATAAAQAPTDSTAAAPAVSVPTDNVRRAVFCSGFAGREPIDEFRTLTTPAEKVYFFTEIAGMEGRTVTHRWIHDGQTVAEVPISVGAARWRCHSTKTLAGNATGSWSVDVLDDTGAKIGGASFTYQAAP